MHCIFQQGKKKKEIGKEIGTCRTVRVWFRQECMLYYTREADYIMVPH